MLYVSNFFCLFIVFIVTSNKPIIFYLSVSALTIYSVYTYTHDPDHTGKFYIILSMLYLYGFSNYISHSKILILPGRWTLRHCDLSIVLVLHIFSLSQYFSLLILVVSCRSSSCSGSILREDQYSDEDS